MEFETLTGAPMYHYNLAKGFRELGHDVVCVGTWIGGKIEKRLREIGCNVYTIEQLTEWPGEYDLAIIAQNRPKFLDYIECPAIYNLVHSKGIDDKPIDHYKIDGYVVPRKQISDYWGIDAKIIPIPIDFEKFSSSRKVQNNEYTIFAPCTIDKLRRPMLLNLLERSKEHKVIITGKNHGGLDGVEIPKNVLILDEVTTHFAMRYVDEVAGIFIGTVTIEAWSMGLKTSVYDENGNWEYVEKPEDFEKHDYKKVTQQFIDLI